MLNSIVVAMDEILDDFMESCDTLREKSPDIAEEYCSFGNEIELFFDILLSMQDGKEEFIKNICEISQQFKSFIFMIPVTSEFITENCNKQVFNVENV